MDSTATETAPKHQPLPLSAITSMDSYFASYGPVLGKKAIDALRPLHVPDRDPLPDLDYLSRPPFPCQHHAVAAIREMMNNVGSGFLCGECGSGKTLMATVGVDLHARQSRNAGGKGGNYRCLVLCPDHLIDKWVREIKMETLPNAKVQRFGREGDGIEDEEDENPKRQGKGKKTESATRRTLRDFAALIDRGGFSHGGKPGRKTWRKPEGAEWYVLGRNQAKWLSRWAGLADIGPGFSGTASRPHTSSKYVVTDQISVKNEFGREISTKYEYGRACYCPKCGTVVRDKKGVPIGDKNLSSGKGVTQKTCNARYAQEIAAPDTPRHEGLDRIFDLPDWVGKKRPADPKTGKPADEFNMGGRRYKIMECGEPLYNYISKPVRWSPARIAQKKLRKFFDYLVVDEVHEHKSDEAARSMACGKLIASVDHVLALTGTIIGGYADHLYPLMMRITPQSLKAEGYEWGKSMDFSEVYGRIDRIYKTTEDSEVAIEGSVGSLRRAKSGNRSPRKAVRPGVMPTMFRHLIGSSIFVTLEELAENLPDLFEYVGGPIPPMRDRKCFDAPGRTEEEADAMFDHEADVHERASDGYFDTMVEMAPDQAAEYKRIATALENANAELLQRGSMKLLGTYLAATSAYPDQPFDWKPEDDLKAALKADPGSQAPGLLGQSFLSNFEHKLDCSDNTLVLTRTENGASESTRVPVKKKGGIYWLDVSFNGKPPQTLAYDTGASSISIPEGMAAEVGIKAKPGGECLIGIADGSTAKANMAVISSVTVGGFTVRNVDCTIVPAGNQPHVLGYWNIKGSKQINNWVGVVTPADLPKDVIYPKERALIDICLKQKQDGTQTWVYLTMTGKRDIQDRLKKLLEAEGLKVGILRAEVDPQEREAWIYKHAGKVDVILSHPELVCTGLDLFAKDGNHNFSTLVFYETGYNLFTMRQASRRAWRIGQPRDCRVYYLYYKDTMQHRAINLMSRKLAAAEALEGEFSEDGLAAMAGEDNIQMALAKAMSEHIADSDMQRSWAKINSNTKKAARKPMDAIKALVPAGQPSKFDGLSPGLQLAAESIVESEAFKETLEFEDDADEVFEGEALSEAVLLKMFQQMDEMGTWE